MKYAHWIVCGSILLFSAALRAQDGAAAKDARVERARALDRFTFLLWKKCDDGKKNAVLSPYSVGEALTLVWAACAGDAKKEIGAALGYGADDDRELQAVRALAEQLSGGAKKSFAGADRLFLADGQNYRPEYFARVEKALGAATERCDFRDPERARTRINAWVAERTEQMIPDLLAPGTVTPATTLMLVNAIRFKASWKKTFDPAKTKEGEFTKADAEKIRLPLMHGKVELSYLENDDVEVAELPYDDGRFAFTVILPRESKTLAEIEKTIDADAFRGLRAKLAKKEMPVTLPKMSIASGYELSTKGLPGVGVKTMFLPSADWSPLAENGGRLAVDRVIHKAVIEVDETGTEAAAATAIAMRGGRPKVFSATRPFLFTITHIETGLVLFIGRFTGEN